MECVAAAGYDPEEHSALAISLEEDDERIYGDYAERLRADFPASAGVLDGMRQEESVHLARLLDRCRHPLPDDRSLTGPGHRWAGGIIEGGMTAIGGIGDTVSFLIPNFRAALFVAIAVVLIELLAISWIRDRYMDTAPLTAEVQVGVGGAWVFVTGLLIRSS
jgi:hypothetical protein